MSHSTTAVCINNPFHIIYPHDQSLIVISYGFGRWAPGVKSPGVGDYLCGHHVMLAHASIYHLYREKYLKKFGGQIGITLESPYYEPQDSSVSSGDLQKAMTYRFGWFAQPIFGKSGGYPDIIVKEIAERSAVEGRAFSRLPELSEEWRQKLRGSADFMGLNYYTGATVRINTMKRPPNEEPGFFKDSGIVESSDPNWKQGQVKWLFR